MIVHTMKGKVLFSDDTCVLEKFLDTNTYRLTLFNKDNHWGGDVTFSKEVGVIYDDLKDDENI